MGGSLQKHIWLQDKLYNHPEILGIARDDILAKNKEFELLYKGHPLTVPDLFYLTPNMIYYYEVKSGHNPSLYSKGMSQLEKITYWNQKHGVENFDATLIMPKKPDYNMWIDMLHDLEYYKLGDTFRK
jgi:hypothetical protein